MRNDLVTGMRAVLSVALALALTPPVSARKGKHTDLAEVLSQMNEASKRLKTVSANLDYTKVTVLVDDKSTQSGRFYFRKGKAPDVRVDFKKPDAKTLLFRKNIGQIYLANINEIQEYDLSQKSDVMQQFLLLGFGSDTNELKKAYNITYLKEEDVAPGDTNVELELTPHKANVSAQISKIQLWVSEESWLPTQQRFFESGGDYSTATYTDVKVNRDLPNSIFDLKTPSNVKIVKMN